MKTCFNFLSENQLTERINSLSGVVKCIVEYAYDAYLPGKFIGYVAELRDAIEQERFKPTPVTSIDSILCLGGEDIDEEFKRLEYTYTYTEPEEMNEGIKIPVTNSFIGVIHNKYGSLEPFCSCRGPPNLILMIYILIIQKRIGLLLYK